MSKDLFPLPTEQEFDEMHQLLVQLESAGMTHPGSHRPPPLVPNGRQVRSVRTPGHSHPGRQSGPSPAEFQLAAAQETLQARDRLRQ